MENIKTNSTIFFLLLFLMQINNSFISMEQSKKEINTSLNIENESFGIYQSNINNNGDDYIDNCKLMFKCFVPGGNEIQDMNNIENIKQMKKKINEIMEFVDMMKDLRKKFKDISEDIETFKILLLFFKPFENPNYDYNRAKESNNTGPQIIYQNCTVNHINHCDTITVENNEKTNFHITQNNTLVNINKGQNGSEDVSENENEDVSENENEDEMTDSNWTHSTGVSLNDDNHSLSNENNKLTRTRSNSSVIEDNNKIDTHEDYEKKSAQE